MMASCNNFPRNRKPTFMTDCQDVLEQYAVFACPVSNKFHGHQPTSTYEEFIRVPKKCCIFEELDTNTFWHVFLEQDVQQSTDGTIICNFIEKKRYRINHYMNTHRKMFFTRLPTPYTIGKTTNKHRKLLTLEHFAKSPLLLKLFIKSRLESYKATIMPIYEPYYLDITQWFDVYNDDEANNNNNKCNRNDNDDSNSGHSSDNNDDDDDDDDKSTFCPIPFRPTSLDTYLTFLKKKRTILFELLRMYAINKAKNHTHAGDGDGDNDDNSSTDIKSVNVKEVKHCSLSSLCRSKRRAIKEFKCKETHPNSCKHIADALLLSGHQNATQLTILKRPLSICHFLVDKYLNKYDESVVANLLNFECFFEKMDMQNNYENPNLENIPSLMNVFTEIYGRVTSAHRLCAPEHYLTKDWETWLDSILNQ